MAIIVGSGEYRYEQIDNWAKVPPGWSLHEVGAVGVDRQDNVYVFNRAPGARACSRAPTACISPPTTPCS